ncbi:MAG: 3-phosphoshikimate 1-carboxyvinyltransferase [Clostridia bacterium]|nr:3-phosphoshikimate 1-carboxyvinyltransferase [Clostridia bacterium]
MKAIVRPGSMAGRLTVPGSKSHTIRAVCIAAMAEGRSAIGNPLASRDGAAAVEACRALGAKIEMAEGVWHVEGTGGRLHTPDNIIDCANSGTTLYFVTAMAATLPTWAVITGDEQIRARPILPLLEQLRNLGAEAFTTRGTTPPPAIVRGPLKSGTVRFDGRFSQYVSSVLLAAPLADGTVRIEVADPKERPYLKMTVDWMTAHGIQVHYDRANYRSFEVTGPQAYQAVNEAIPSDWESVAFPLVASVITGSTLVIEDVDVSGGQGDAAIVDVLQRMGANLKLDAEKKTLTVEQSGKLQGVTINCSDIPDAAPILAVAGCFGRSPMRLEGLEMVRAKETDRVAVMKEEIAKMGGRVEDTHDTMTIYPAALRGAIVASHGDHRVAMALAVAGLAAEGQTTVTDAECHDISYPGFFESMNKLGAGFVLEY